MPRKTRPAPRKPEYLADRAYRDLRDRIMTGEFRPGDHLKEDDLVKRLGVSRSVVRQVLIRLTAEGLLRDEPKRGKTVYEYTDERLAKLLPIRLVLEQLAVREAVARLTPADIAELRSIAARLRDPNLELAEQDALDVRLHQKIWNVAGNEELERILHQVVGPFHMTSHAAMLSALGKRGSAAISWQQVLLERERDAGGHQLLVEALCEKDEAAALKAIEDHLLFNYDSSPQEYARHMARLSSQRHAPR